MNAPAKSPRAASDRIALAATQRAEAQRAGASKVDELRVQIEQAELACTRRIAQIDAELAASHAAARVRLVADLRRDLDPLVREWINTATRETARKIDLTLRAGLDREGLELPLTNTTPITVLVLGDLFVDVARETSPGLLNQFGASGDPPYGYGAALGAVQCGAGSPSTLCSALATLEKFVFDLARQHGSTTPHPLCVARWAVKCGHDYGALQQFEREARDAAHRAFVASYEPPPRLIIE